MTDPIETLMSLAEAGKINVEVKEESTVPEFNMSEVEEVKYAEDYDAKLTEELGVNVYTILSSQTPSKLNSITLKEALFKDRVQATRMYPKGVKVGYTLEDLLLSNLVVSVKYERVDSLPEFVRNPTDKIKLFPASDVDFIRSTVLSCITINKEDAALIKTRTEKVIQDPNFNGVYTISAEDMPTGSFSVTFKEPTTQDKWNVEQIYPGANDDDCGYTMEELLLVRQLVSVNDEPVKLSKDSISFLNDWSHIDVQYAVATFTSLFNLSMEQSEASRQLGKSILQKRRAKMLKGK